MSISIDGVNNTITGISLGKVIQAVKFLVLLLQ